jgi:eukaryotic-like serine/threonine-protein kinase
MTEALPSRIGRYEPRKEVGRGTMGVVYEAWDPDLGRTIALKVVAPAFGATASGRESYERRFLSEARAAARLSHPAIVVVHDVGRDPASGHVFMALEYLTGTTLHDRLAAGPLPWREALRIVRRVAEGLHHAHTNGVVHRDVKPANIMILPSGEAKILDFGIARVDAGHLTVPGEMFGTPLYMAPEQALGGTVDARSDLFSLGAVAYTVLCGRPAFEGSSVPAIVARITQREAPPLSQVVPGLPADVDDLLARAMAKAPADRYADVQMFADDLEDVLAGRTPRHRAQWTRPAPADGTLPAATLPEPPLPELELEEVLPAEKPPRPRRGRWRLFLFALLLGAAAAYFVEHRTDLEFWRRELPRLAHTLRTYSDKVALVPPREAPPARPQPVSVPAPAPPAAVPGATPEAPPTPSPAPEDLAPAAPASPTPTPTPTPEARETPAAAATPAAKRTPAPRAASQLLLEVEHQPGAGTLELWVDGTRVLQEPLGARSRRRPAVGIEVGRRRIEVRLKAGRSTRSARTTATFKPGTTRRLGVAVLRGGVPALEWR